MQTNIIITGASKGIGYETVKRLSQNTNNNIIAIARNTQLLQALKQTCKKTQTNTNLHIIPYNIASLDAKKQLLPFVKQHMSSIDILLNNAGILIHKNFENITQEDIQTTFNTNLYAPINIIQTLLPLLKKSSHPHIVNISSMGGFQGSVKFSGMSIYSASKAALSILTECLAEELKENNIAVNCLALGGVQTEMLQQAFPNYQAPITAEEMAKHIAEFCLNGYKYYNGKVLPVALSTP